jgi:biopolymer transport protein ExbD
MAATSRGQAMREARRTAQFAKFRLVNLNLIPLVDTFVSIVFFALTTSTVGELAPVVTGVNLPSSRVGQVAHQQLTLGVTEKQVTIGGRTVMGTGQAAASQSNIPNQPLVIPQLYSALQARADSIRRVDRLDPNESLPTPLAIQAEKTMRYDLLSRVMQTARVAGFRNITLQVLRQDQPGTTPRVL